MSSIPVTKSDPFVPTPADFGAVTCDSLPAATKRGGLVAFHHIWVTFNVGKYAVCCLCVMFLFCCLNRVNYWNNVMAGGRTWESLACGVETTDAVSVCCSRSSSGDRGGGRRSKRGSSRDSSSGGSKRGRWAAGARSAGADLDHSPPSSPDSDQPVTPKRGRKRAAAVAAALELKE